MKAGDCNYRFGVIDGPSRAGFIEHGAKTLPLPAMIDYRFPGLKGPFKASGRVLSPGWEDLELELVRSEERLDEDSPLLASTMKALRSIGAERMGPVIQHSHIRISLDVEGVSRIIPLEAFPLPSLHMLDPRSLVGSLWEMTISDPLHPPQYLPGVVDGSNLEALFYMGVELFDTARARYDGFLGLYYTHSGSIRLEDMERYSYPKEACRCDACLQIDSFSDEEAGGLISEHNAVMLRDRLAVAMYHLRDGSLREHVMGCLSGKPDWVSAIRRFETGSWPSLSGYVPTYRSEGTRPVTYLDDIHSPEFRLWEGRITDEYSPPKGKEILLLLPCSARKPYSESRTHLMICDVLSGLKGWRDVVQRLVLTSPLGAVPMELERCYPAAQYDVPVTGDWYSGEVQRIRRLTGSIIESGRYSLVIDFHESGGLFFPEARETGTLFGVEYMNVHVSADKGGRSPQAVLREFLREAIDRYRGDPKLGRREELRSLLQFSLGIDLADSPLRIKRDRRGMEIRMGKVRLAGIRRGGPVPTIEGGAELWDIVKQGGGGRRVIVEGFIPKGNVFGAGITRVEGKVRPGDIVLVGSEEDFLGVGRSLAPGRVIEGKPRGAMAKMISHVRG